MKPSSFNPIRLLPKWWTALVNPKNRPLIQTLLVSVCIAVIVLYSLNLYLHKKYASLESVSIKDRNGVVLTLYPNQKGFYSEYSTTTPARVKELVIKKEDRFFYGHPGINPLSMLRYLWNRAWGGRDGGTSTITEQLVKNLLGHEQSRTLSNKAEEGVLALVLDLFTSKEEIFDMYANSIFMGNQIQGLAEASVVYFEKPLESLDDTELARLLATISSPSTQHPWKGANTGAAESLSKKLGLLFNKDKPYVARTKTYNPPQNYELLTMQKTCDMTCTTSLDGALTEDLRAILNKRVTEAWSSGARTGAIIVIKVPENELLAVVGTPDKTGEEAGHQINMAIEPRPIGSTAKPFVYLEGFEQGLRPYTLVDDREYKFPTASGLPLYPKNYDGQYRGWIMLHDALSNSLNVPTVKTLQYVGLQHFYDFMEHELRFTPLQDWDTYQYGIALGGLEMDPLTLAEYLTIFPNNGILKPLHLFANTSGIQSSITTPMSSVRAETRVADSKYTELVTAILSDRIRGVEQFGLASNLNLFQSNYAVKTGTSRDYHDSWTVGYTPDFLVVTWLGNAENKPLLQISGQAGAGAVWHDAMTLLLNSPYNKKTPLSIGETTKLAINGNLEVGLPDDVITEHRNLLKGTDLITSPQNGDLFLLDSQAIIPLVATEPVRWYVDGHWVGTGIRSSFSPTLLGTHILEGETEDGTTAKIQIEVRNQMVN